MKCYVRNKKKYYYILILLIISFLVNLSDFVSDENIHPYLDQSLTKLGFQSLQFLSWLLLLKIQIILILGIWFLTSSHWWKIAIIIPLTIEIFKLSEIFNSNVSIIDEKDFLTSLPFTIPIILSFIYLFRKLFYFKFILKINSEIENEIFSYSNYNERNVSQQKFEELRERFNTLKVNKENFKKEIYLNQLKKIITELNN